MTHCRTAEHIANVCGLNDDDKQVFFGIIRQQAAKKAAATKKANAKKAAAEQKANTPRRIRKTMTVYKAVAITDDWRMVSIYDGETEYHLNTAIEQPVRANHRGGLYAYESINEARYASLPYNSAEYYNNYRVILKCKATGEMLRYGSKLAVSKLVPVEAYAC